MDYQRDISPPRLLPLPSAPRLQRAGNSNSSPPAFAQQNALRLFAARLGFEPRYSDSESEVLPLDDLAIQTDNTLQIGFIQLNKTAPAPRGAVCVNPSLSRVPAPPGLRRLHLHRARQMCLASLRDQP